MNTPITDAAIKDYIANGQPDRTFGKPMARLELDRAALRAILMKFMEFADSEYVPNALFEQAERALSAARANFPTE